MDSNTLHQVYLFQIHLRQIAKFTAPAVNSQTSLKFHFVVNNGQDNSKPSTVTVNVQPLSPVPQPIPVADAGKPQTVNSSDIVTLDGSKKLWSK